MRAGTAAGGSRRPPRPSRPRPAAGSIGARASARAGSSRGPEVPATWARTLRSWAMRSTRSPARDASAASSRAASIEASIRGTSPIRAAEVREVSSTMSTRRSRSGRQVRTTTSERRAVARQSIERTSSPITYSRSESNSVPAPRICTAVRPSSSRSRASRLGRWRREANSGSTRSRPGTSADRWRAASRSGPNERTVTRSASRSPRRVGSRGVTSRADSPGGRDTACRFRVAPADGCHASRTTPRTRCLPSLVTTRVDRDGWVSRTDPGTVRRTTRSRGEPASARSTSTASSTSTAQPSTTPYAGASSTGTTPRPARATARQDSTMLSGVPGPRRGPCPARSRR